MVYLLGLGVEIFGIFLDNLVYVFWAFWYFVCIAIWYFCGNFGTFFPFGFVTPRKIWQLCILVVQGDQIGRIFAYWATGVTFSVVKVNYEVMQK
jgi:hypothetical protein